MNATSAPFTNTGMHAAGGETMAFASLSPPVWRASTVVFPSLDAFVNRRARLPDGFTYGTTGTPTQRALEARIAALDQAAHCVLAPSGQAAICLALLMAVQAGDHLLMTESAYGTARTFATQHLAQLGVAVELYDPRIGARIEQLFRANTRLVWMESPGSITMEVQDVPAIVAGAARHSIPTAIDNTWATSLGFRALAHGVDLCIQACTKYMGGHSDVLMGSITTNDPLLYRRVRQLQGVMGQAVSAEDCFLVSRGLDTLQVRLRQQVASAERIAAALERHAMVHQVLYPSLDSSPDYGLWRRDFAGTGAVLSVQLQPAPYDAYSALFSAFRRFAIGASWGGVHSVAAFYPQEEIAARKYRPCDGPLMRLSIGLEDPEELIAELVHALQVFQQARNVHHTNEEISHGI